MTIKQIISYLGSYLNEWSTKLNIVSNDLVYLVGDDINRLLKWDDLDKANDFNPTKLTFIIHTDDFVHYNKPGDYIFKNAPKIIVK